MCGPCDTKVKKVLASKNQAMPLTFCDTQKIKKYILFKVKKQRFLEFS